MDIDEMTELWLEVGGRGMIALESLALVGAVALVSLGVAYLLRKRNPRKW